MKQGYKEALAVCRVIGKSVTPKKRAISVLKKLKEDAITRHPDSDYHQELIEGYSKGIYTLENNYKKQKD